MLGEGVAVRRRAEGPTAGQLRVLRLVVESYRARLPQPSIRELCDVLGLSSTNGVAEHLRQLEAKGLITRAAQRARSVRPTPAGERWGRG